MIFCLADLQIRVRVGITMDDQNFYATIGITFAHASSDFFVLYARLHLCQTNICRMPIHPIPHDLFSLI